MTKTKKEPKPGTFGAKVAEELAKPENSDLLRIDDEFVELPDNATIPGMPAQVKTVRGNLMLANYLEPKYSEGKGGEKLLTLHVSMPLTPEHQDVLPRKILEAWDFLAESEDKLHIVQGIRNHTCDFFLVPDDDAPLFRAEQAALRAVKLAFVQEKGSGKTVHFIRLSLGLQISAGDDPQGFATKSYGSELWIALYEKQGKMKLGPGAE
jgi:hypothetical protein